MGRPTKSNEMPLQPQVVVTPFDKWGIDFVSPIEPSSHGKLYILVFIDYATKWIEAQAITHAKDHKVTDLINECIFT